MSNCVYSDPKLKNVHYHVHQKREGPSIEGLQAGLFSQQQQGTHAINVAQGTSLAQLSHNHHTHQKCVGTSINQKVMNSSCQQNHCQGVGEVRCKDFNVTGKQRVFNTGYVEVDTTQVETIDINQKLLAERDQLRVRVYQLEQELMGALDVQKDQILLTCEQQYSLQLAEIESQHIKILEIERREKFELKQTLDESQAKIETLEQNISALKQNQESFEKLSAKQLEKQKGKNEVFKKEIQDQAEKYDEEILLLKEKIRQASSLSDKTVRGFYEEQITNLKTQLTWRDARVAKLEQDCSSLDQQLHLKTMELSSFQLQSRIQLQEQLDKFSLQRGTSESEKQVTDLRKQYEKIVIKLEDKIDKQKIKIQKYKLEAKKIPIQVDPIIIERPIQVETIVENTKYLPVERVVKGSAIDRAGGQAGQGGQSIEKESELIKHYEEVMERDAQKIDTLQRKIHTLSKLNQLQIDQQALQDQQVIDAEETLRKFQVENENLKEGLRSFEINLNNATQQYESQR